MRFSSLSAWLSWQEGLHPSTIELGLDRVQKVFQRLHPSLPPIPIISVAGTNGKGSSVALLEAIYQNAGYKTGCYTSPHLLRYNERIHLNAEEVSDQQICDAFERVDQARCQESEISLTYFEFGTLAALDIFFRAKPEVIILEVGLGGRLDAVNIVDADVALITSIGIDHTAWLGNDRETIAREKAGIMRKDHPVVFSSPDMPKSIEQAANEVGAVLYQRGSDFDWKNGVGYAAWDWKSNKQQRTALPTPSLRGKHQLDNAAGVLMVIECLADKLPVNQKQIKAALLSASVPGRFQCLAGDPMHILDVAHNEGSMACLAELLNSQVCGGNNVAVLGMLEDKDHAAALAVMLPEITHWYVADLDVPRGVKAEILADVLKKLDSNTVVDCFSDVKHAIEAADAGAGSGDRVIIFGSFYTVEFAMQSGI
ncbi:MAG: bifunctional tetrahydrofolate synthase/dihydrofolate synthase [Gammaproteobacteria bacterium]|nr:bifunctional tetrahydrofolate synthase/dihydrofolate synthase [Gammaproteobacteria bacterium]